MGTSQSSSGPGSHIPMVPPWVPDLPPDGAPPADGEPQDPGVPDVVPIPPPPNSPPRRFGGARRSLGEYARSGDRGAMRRSLSHYVRSGYGGNKTAVRRFGGTVRNAAVLNAVLGGAAVEGTSRLDPVLMTGRTADEVMNAIVEATRPVDGTQDAEAARVAIREALSNLLTRFPEADLLNLDTDQRNFVIERYVALDVFQRFQLDVGRTIIGNAPSATTALSRLKQVRDYIKETVAAAFRKLHETGRRITAGGMSQVVRDALAETFQVFEEYLT